MSPEIWMLLGAIAFAGVLAMLYTLAETVRCEQCLHEARISTARRRQQFLSQLHVPDDEIIVVDEAPPEPEDQAA